MWFFSEPLWVRRRKTFDNLYPEVSMNLSRQELSPESGQGRGLFFQLYSKWAKPAECALWFQNISMYSFLAVLMAYFTHLKKDLNTTHAYMTCAISAAFMAHYISSTMWLSCSKPILSVRMTVFIASLLSSAMTLIYIYFPVSIAFNSMVIFKGLFYGFIMVPTQTLIGHYYQNDPVRLHIFDKVYLMIPVSTVLFGQLLQTQTSIHVAFVAIFVLDTISCVCNLIFLSRTFIFKRVVTQEQLLQLVNQGHRNHGVAMRQNVQEEEELVDFVGEDRADVGDCREDTTRAQSSEIPPPPPPPPPPPSNDIPAPHPEDHSDEAQRARFHREIRTCRLLREQEQGLQNASLLGQWLWPYRVVLLTLQSNDSWFFSNPKMRYAVLGQAFLQPCVIACFFFVALCQQSKVSTDNAPYLIPIMWFSYIFFVYPIRCIRYRFALRVRAIMWMCAFGMGVLCWKIENFNSFSSLAGLSVGFGIMGFSIIGLSMENLIDFHDEGGMGRIIGVTNLIGVVMFSVVFIILGVILDQYGSVYYVYHILGGFIICGSLPLFWSSLVDAFDALLSLCLPMLPVQCQKYMPEKYGEEKRPLISSYEPI